MAFIKKIFLFLLFIDLIVLNIIVGVLVYNSIFLKDNKETDSITELNLIQEGKLSNIEECSNECRKEIESVVSEKLSFRENDISPTPTKKIEVKVNKVRHTYYVPIPGSGSTLERDWVDLSGTDFYLSKNDYPGLVEVYFEGNIKLFNANGKAYFRLYDKTHSIGVNGSQIETSSQVSTFVSSGKLNFWDGYNHYIVQAKTLSADTAVYESGRLKIITQE